MFQLTHHCSECSQRLLPILVERLPERGAVHRNRHRICKHPDCRAERSLELPQHWGSTSKAWLLFYNELKHPLSLRRDRRQDADEFLQTVKTQYDRLFELSPICSSDMIGTIKKKIAANATAAFVTPTYLNGFRHTEVYGAHESDSYEDNESVPGNEV